MTFQILNHPADLKIRVTGKNLKMVFLELAAAMQKNLKKKIPKKITKRRTLAVKSPDTQGLLINFLSEILCLADTHNEIYPQIKITYFTKTALKAQLFGAPVESFDVEIKAVTYAGEVIKKTKNGYIATVIFDI